MNLDRKKQNSMLVALIVLSSLIFLQTDVKVDGLTNKDITDFFIGSTKEGEGDTQAPVIHDIGHTETVTERDKIDFIANVTDNVEVISVILIYRINEDGIWNNITMVKGVHVYTTSIGPFSAGNIIQYYVQAEDIAGNVGISETFTITIFNSKFFGVNLTIFYVLIGVGTFIGVLILMGIATIVLKLIKRKKIAI